MATKKNVKKSVAKKAPVKKPVAKKGTPKKPVAKKAAAKKTPAKKPVAKKPVAKKVVAKKVAAKKVAVKKSASKKVAVKESVSKKVAAKEVAVKKPVSAAEASDVVQKAASSARKPYQTKKDIEAERLAAEEASRRTVEEGMQLALLMKRRAAQQADRDDAASAIRLSRRPTTRSQGRSTEKFPASDLREFRKRLLDERERALQGARAMQATNFDELDQREADGGDGTNQTLRLQALGQMGNIQRTLQKIEEALHRIDDGTYGVCTACGQLIRKPRLQNQPFVLTCMECQSEMERTNRA